jgi:hypothetical protein
MNFLMASILDFPAKLFAGRLFIINPRVVLLRYISKSVKKFKVCDYFSK